MADRLLLMTFGTSAGLAISVLLAILRAMG